GEQGARRDSTTAQLGVARTTSASGPRQSSSANSSNHKNEPLAITIRGKSIAPMFTLDKSVGNWKQGLTSPTEPYSAGRRVLKYRSLYKIYARLEDEDMAHSRSDTLKLQSPDMYWLLHLFFGFRVEAIGGDGFSRVFTMTDLCRHYIDHARLAEQQEAQGRFRATDSLGGQGPVSRTTTS
ncbi:unnamed protein product, partial [Amoebophrya sp. A25]